MSIKILGASKNSGVSWVREILSPDEGEKTKECFVGTSKNSGVRWGREILSPDEGEKTKEYFVYFKFLRQNQGAKDPASSHS